MLLYSLIYTFTSAAYFALSGFFILNFFRRQRSRTKEIHNERHVDSNLFDSFSVTYEQNYHFSVPNLPGQNFIGWLNKDDKYVTDSSGAVNDLFWKMENTSTIVLTADLEIIIYQITFCEECLGKSLTSIEYNVFSDTINLEEEVGIPKKSGYRFKGWYDSCEHTGDSIKEIASGSIGNIELHADWSLLLYVDYYDVNGRFLHSDEVEEGDTIYLYDFKKAGYNDGYTWNGYLNKDKVTVRSDMKIYLREKYWEELYNVNHYEIWTANQLNQIRSHSDDIIYLMTDITCTGNWTPIPVFSGELYMYGHTVTYQHNNVAYNTTYGFIKELTSSGRIINGTFVPKIKATASGSGYADVAIGGAVGVNRGELLRVKVISKIGSNNDSYNSSSNPNVDIHVKHPYYYVGGIVGQNYGVIDTCWNYASIGGDASNIGGIAGVNMESGEIIKAYNHGNIWYEMSISRTAYIGGVAGTVADGGYMNNISNYGKITFAMLSSTVSQTNVSYLANIAGSACETATITIYGCFGTVSVANALIGKISGFQIDAVKQNGDPIAYSFPKPGSGGSGNEGGGCVALGTLITLADGTQVPVESLTGNEMLLVWDMKTGTFGTAPVLFIDSDPYGLYNVIYLSFSDGTGLEVITEHALWDYNLNKYVFMDENAMQYIGHWFNKQSINIEGQLVYSKVQLVDVTVSVEYSVAYSPVTYSYLCYYVNGMLSMPGATQGLINIFEVDAETMKYDEAQMQADIAQNGLFTYEEFAEMFPISEEVFEAFNGKYLKVAMGKGLIDAEGLQMLIERYAEFLSVIG